MKRQVGIRLKREMRLIAGILGFFVVTLLSCQEERETPDLLISAYLPLNLGQYWTYEVVERVYFGENDFEENEFYYRDRITRQFVNEINEIVHVITRERSENLQDWGNELAYTLNFSRNRIIRTIDNEPVIPLVYPVQVFQQWDANGMNANLPELFTVEEIGSYVVGNRAFGSAAMIRQSEEDDLITLRDNRFEVYAEGIGMVESYYEVFAYCSRSDCLGEQIIQSGRFKQMKLIANGIL
ncbi:hypothetical protein [Lunatibacter salilacus]|uniref:hypothetical protein n=1 Tax=Lunatibacter salilacus TaxID=2483804 RepID=UPI00131AAD7F|nr:hypothetical protein [Lunatibacter salilacus]